jgi:hypothetical protein
MSQCGRIFVKKGKRERKKERKNTPFAATFDWADIGLCGWVALLVPGEGGRVWEDLAAAVNDADMAGGVRVTLEVLVEDIHSGKLLGASWHGAGVRLLPSVGADVHDELHLGGEGLFHPRAVGPLTGCRERVAARVAVDVVVEDVLAQNSHEVEALRAASPVADVLLLLTLGRSREREVR